MNRRDFFKSGGLAALAGAASLTQLSVHGAEGTAPAITSGPHLQELRPDGVTVVWTTDRECTGWVEYGVDGRIDQRAVHSSHGLIDAMTRTHRVTLENLRPGTAYTYRIHAKEIMRFLPYEVAYGGTASSEPVRFSTPAAAESTLSFVVFNDVHAKKNVWERLIPLAGKEPFDMAFLNGDNISDPMSHEAVVRGALAPLDGLLAGVRPFVLVRGNHETRGAWARRLPEYVVLPEGRYYHSFTRGPVRFLVLDCGEDKTDQNKEYFGLVDFDRYIAEQMKWLEGEIAKPEFQAAPFRVGFVHIPWPLEEPRGNSDPRDRFKPLLESANLDLLICGHTHQHAVVEPAPGRSYPIFVGGGNEPGTATLIRVKATEQDLSVVMLRDNGEPIAEKRIGRSA